MKYAALEHLDILRAKFYLKVFHKKKTLLKMLGNLETIKKSEFKELTKKGKRHVLILIILIKRRLG